MNQHTEHVGFFPSSASPGCSVELPYNDNVLKDPICIIPFGGHGKDNRHVGSANGPQQQLLTRWESQVGPDKGTP